MIINVNETNAISAELKAIVRKSLPKRDQAVYFESLRPKSRGTTVLPIDRIYDPFKVNELGDKGAFVDIAYVTGRNPGKKLGDVASDVVGRIQFTKNEMGRIAIRGGNRDDEQKFTFMFLTNHNANNHKKDWFVATEMKQPCFKFIEPGVSASVAIEKERDMRKAGAVIDEMEPAKLREFAAGLDFKNINKFTTDDEIRLQLIRISKTEGGAAKILGLDKDVNVKMKSVLKDAEKLKIIERDAALNSFVWSDSKDLICLVPPGKNLYDFMVGYFLDKGAKSYETIQQLVVREKESGKKEKPDKEPVVKNK